MASQKPTSLAEWATMMQALVSEPPDSFKQLGFTTSQPTVNHFNWVFKNLYEWVCFLDSQAGGGFLYHEHDTSRPRIHIPFSLPASGKLSNLEVLKKTNGSVAGVSATAYAGTASVMAGDEGQEELTFVAGRTAAGNYGGYNAASGLLYQTFSPGSAFVEGVLNGQNVLRGFFNQIDGSSSPFQAEGNFQRAGFNFNQSNDGLEVSTGNLISPNFHATIFSSDDDDNFWSNILATNQVFLIAGNSAQGVARGECVIWNLNSASDINNVSSLSPVYKNIEITTSLTHWRAVKSYNASLADAEGSALATALNLDNTSPFNMASYAYDPGNQEIKIVLSGTVSQTAFHTLSIRQGGEDVLNLLASAATYDNTAKSFTWDSIASDPLLAGGSTEFLFRTSGSGLNVIDFNPVPVAGLAIETYDGKDYLHISAGVSNGEAILIRKVSSS